MTVVAGLADAVSNSVILVADSRVTAASHAAHFDVCAKTANLDNQGLFGFAGPVVPALAISHWISGTFEKRGTGWFNSRSEVMGLLTEIGALGQSDLNSFLVAFMDDTNLCTEPWAEGKPRATLVRFSTDGDYARTCLGIEIIGSGSETYEAIRPHLTDLLKFSSLGRAGQAAAHRALFMSHMVVTEAKARSIDSVGGLMQVFFVEDGGVRAIPYERWVDIDQTHGTYVLMDIDAEGRWVQIHEPSGLRAPLRFPTAPDFGAVNGATCSNFELERHLTRDSPGVQPRPNPLLAWRGFGDGAGGWKVRTPVT